MVVFNDPVPVDNPALQAVLMALEMRHAIGALTEKWRRLGHDLASASASHMATRRSEPSASRVASTTPSSGRCLMLRHGSVTRRSRDNISLRVLVAVEDAVKVEPVGEVELKGIRRPLAAYNVIDALA